MDRDVVYMAGIVMILAASAIAQVFEIQARLVKEVEAERLTSSS